MGKLPPRAAYVIEENPFLTLAGNPATVGAPVPDADYASRAKKRKKKKKKWYPEVTANSQAVIWPGVRQNRFVCTPSCSCSVPSRNRHQDRELLKT